MKRAVGLDRLFNPRAIAIIGASSNTSAISGQPLANLVQQGYAGGLYPVNPKYEELLGHRCYASIGELPEVPDLAMVLVAAEHVLSTVQACGQAGIPLVMVCTAGFAETGETGSALQDRLGALAREYGIRLIGPNCQGLMNFRTGTLLGFGSSFSDTYTPGAVGMVSQSGGFGSAVVSIAATCGLGFSKFISSGNEQDLNTLDFINYFIDDDETRIIAVYLEGLKDARGFIETARRAAYAGKPLLIWKVGTSDAGARAAASHTANLSGARELYAAALRQGGAVQVREIDDVVDFEKVWRPGKLPAGNRVAIITISGGAGILLADSCSEGNMVIPRLQEDTIAALRPIVTDFASLANPLDVGGGIFRSPGAFETLLQKVVEDTNVDSVIVALGMISGETGTNAANAIVRVNALSTKPIMAVWSARQELNATGFGILDANAVPWFRTPVRGARALGALMQFANSVRQLDEKPELDHADRQARAGAMLAAMPGALNEHAAKKILREYDIPVTRERLAGSRTQALDAARALGLPVVMKIQSADIAHKSEIGGVLLGIDSEARVMESYDLLLERARTRAPHARIDGVLVQESIEDGVEMIVGMSNDAVFGPVVTVGLGGIYTEVLRDVASHIGLVGESDARRLLTSLKAYPILAGARGREPADVDALVDVIQKISLLGLHFADSVAEVEVNPLVVLPQGRGVRALDALITRLPAGKADVDDAAGASLKASTAR
nr:acetate--CoA ligase family protein [Pseudomonas sp.]